MQAKLEVKEVTLDIPVFDSSRSLRKLVYGSVGGKIQPTHRQHVCVRALDNISFALETGDRLGLIGHNGAGKTTLLNVLSGIYMPHCGHIKTTGKVTPLFNINLGMDTDDTGYENIYTIGMYYGMSRQLIDRKKAEIIEFSDLGDYIYLPARTYSSGMLLRLSFAIITSLQPDILVMDETIGVGDASFAKRAKTKLEDFYANIGIIVIASHSDEIIKQMCNKAMLLEHGRMIKLGGVNEVLELYHSRLGT